MRFACVSVVKRNQFFVSSIVEMYLLVSLPIQYIPMKKSKTKWLSDFQGLAK